MISELQSHHESEQQELSAQLDRESQKEEEEYIRKMEENKQRLLQEKQSKLNAITDASGATEEHKRQVYC